MKEDFLHYLWKYKKFAFAKAETTTKQTITLLNVGHHNMLAGPDFFNASLEIDQQLWAGNVEIHLKSSDWYAHGHETDDAYNNVILHVVWEHDVEIYRADNSPIPTLQIKDYVSPEALHNYQNLFANQSQKWINCEGELSEVPEMIISNWLERLYFERLASKTELITSLLEKTNNDWEATLFVLLMKSFGTKVNADAFQSLAEKIDFKTLRKCAQEPFTVEALLLGMGDLIPEDSIDSYPMQLQGEFAFIKQKFNLTSDGILPLQFFKLRPDNFPTLRLSQMSQLYYKHHQLFKRLMSVESIDEVYDIFKITASPYWDTHFNFGKTQKKRSKKLTKSFIDLLIINTIIPLRFEYAKQQGSDDNEIILQLIQQLKPEVNTVTKGFKNIGLKANNAQESQAVLELKISYCDVNRCLSCGVGNFLVGRK